MTIKYLYYKSDTRVIIWPKINLPPILSFNFRINLKYNIHQLNILTLQFYKNIIDRRLLTNYLNYTNLKK